MEILKSLWRTVFGKQKSSNNSNNNISVKKVKEINTTKKHNVKSIIEKSSYVSYTTVPKQEKKIVTRFTPVIKDLKNKRKSLKKIKHKISKAESEELEKKWNQKIPNFKKFRKNELLFLKEDISEVKELEEEYLEKLKDFQEEITTNRPLSSSESAIITKIRALIEIDYDLKLAEISQLNRLDTFKRIEEIKWDKIYENQFIREDEISNLEKELYDLKWSNDEIFDEDNRIKTADKNMLNSISGNIQHVTQFEDVVKNIGSYKHNINLIKSYYTSKTENKKVIDIVDEYRGFEFGLENNKYDYNLLDEIFKDMTVEYHDDTKGTIYTIQSVEDIKFDLENEYSIHFVKEFTPHISYGFKLSISNIEIYSLQGELEDTLRPIQYFESIRTGSGFYNELFWSDLNKNFKYIDSIIESGNRHVVVKNLSEVLILANRLINFAEIAIPELIERTTLFVKDAYTNADCKSDINQSWRSWATQYNMFDKFNIKEPESKNISQGEEKMSAILKRNGFNFEVEKKFNNTGRSRFDFYLTKENLVIEVDGEQHFRDVPLFRTPLAEQHKIDIYKTQAIINNGMSIIRIDYKSLFDKKMEIGFLNIIEKASTSKVIVLMGKSYNDSPLVPFFKNKVELVLDY